MYEFLTSFIELDTSINYTSADIDIDVASSVVTYLLAEEAQFEVPIQITTAFK